MEFGKIIFLLNDIFSVKRFLERQKTVANSGERKLTLSL